MGAPRIALVHAVFAAIAPIEAAFRRRWPEAQTFNVVDDGMPADLQRDGRLTDAMHARILRLAEHALAADAQGVLFTCSAFGDAIVAAARRLPVPVLRPDEAMFDAAMRCGSRIGLLATFEPAVAATRRDFLAQAARQGLQPTLDVVCVAGAHAATRVGDLALHDRLVAEAAPQLAHCDAVMLAHFSTSTALQSVREVLRCEVLSAPEAAVERIKALTATHRPGV